MQSRKRYLRKIMSMLGLVFCGIILPDSRLDARAFASDFPFISSFPSQPVNGSRFAPPPVFNLDLQKSVLNRWYRFSAGSGLQIVESPVSKSNEAFYQVALHLLIFRTINLETYGVLEGAWAQGNDLKKLMVDEDESVELTSLNTTTYHMNVEFIGMNWLTHNPWQIFPYTTFGIGVMSRPERKTDTIKHFETEADSVTITMRDISPNTTAINLGVGFQIYYVSRVDFRVFLVHPGSVALYRFGLKFIF